MRNDEFNLWQSIDNIQAVLSRNQVNTTKSMQLIGFIINVAEAEMRIRRETVAGEREQMVAILMRILDVITTLVGALGSELEEREFQELLAYTSEIHLWASKIPHG